MTILQYFAVCFISLYRVLSCINSIHEHMARWKYIFIEQLINFSFYYSFCMHALILLLIFCWICWVWLLAVEMCHWSTSSQVDMLLNHSSKKHPWWRNCNELSINCISQDNYSSNNFNKSVPKHKSNFLSFHICFLCVFLTLSATLCFHHPCKKLVLTFAWIWGAYRKILECTKRKGSNGKYPVAFKSFLRCPRWWTLQVDFCDDMICQSKVLWPYGFSQNMPSD